MTGTGSVPGRGELVFQVEDFLQALPGLVWRTLGREQPAHLGLPFGVDLGGANALLGVSLPVSGCVILSSGA